MCNRSSKANTFSERDGGLSLRLSTAIQMAEKELCCIKEKQAAPGKNGRAASFDVVTADIGTDHGYLPIALVQSGAADRAIAADVNEGPLNRAMHNIAEVNLSERIETRLSDGLAAFAPGEAALFTICGMGGELILRILNSNPAVTEAAESFVLGPQSKVFEVRRSLRERGFFIAEEALVEEDGKLYPLLCVRRGKNFAQQVDAIDNELRDRYGYQLILRKDPALKKFLAAEHKRLVGICERTAGERREEIKRELALCEAAMTFTI